MLIDRNREVLDAKPLHMHLSRMLVSAMGHLKLLPALLTNSYTLLGGRFDVFKGNVYAALRQQLEAYRGRSLSLFRLQVMVRLDGGNHIEFTFLKAQVLCG